MSKVVDVVSNTNHADGQLARANYGVVGSRVPRARGHAGRVPLPCKSKEFIWDGLALIQRGDEQFINEPHIGGGNWTCFHTEERTFWMDATRKTGGVEG